MVEGGSRTRQVVALTLVLALVAPQGWAQDPCMPRPRFTPGPRTYPWPAYRSLIESMRWEAGNCEGRWGPCFDAMFKTNVGSSTTGRLPEIATALQAVSRKESKVPNASQCPGFGVNPEDVRNIRRYCDTGKQQCLSQLADAAEQLRRAETLEPCLDARADEEEDKKKDAVHQQACDAFRAKQKAAAEAQAARDAEQKAQAEDKRRLAEEKKQSIAEAQKELAARKADLKRQHEEQQTKRNQLKMERAQEILRANAAVQESLAAGAQGIWDAYVANEESKDRERAEERRVEQEKLAEEAAREEAREEEEAAKLEFEEQERKLADQLEKLEESARAAKTSGRQSADVVTDSPPVRSAAATASPRQQHAEKGAKKARSKTPPQEEPAPLPRPAERPAYRAAAVAQPTGASGVAQPASPLSGFEPQRTLERSTATPAPPSPAPESRVKPAPVASWEADRVDVSEPIEVDDQTALFRPSSLPALEQVANLLVAEPRVRINVVCLIRGERPSNSAQVRAQLCASLVQEKLIELGVAPDRLTAEGALLPEPGEVGASKLRVEFLIAADDGTSRSASMISRPSTPPPAPEEADKLHRVSLVLVPTHIIGLAGRVDVEVRLGRRFGLAALLAAGYPDGLYLEGGLRFSVYLLNDFDRGIQLAVQASYFLNAGDFSLPSLVFTPGGQEGLLLGVLGGYKYTSAIGFTVGGQLGVTFLPLSVRRSIPVSPIVQGMIGWSF
jgi:hypothetical protein